MLNRYSGYVVGVFAEIKSYFSGSCRRGRPAALKPGDFSPAMDEQKTILQDGALFSTHPFSTKNHKTTIIPFEGFGRFFRGRCGKSNALLEAAFPTSTPLKNRRNLGGDDRQVSQNGMPFCTGCTLSGHILNLQGSSTPFEPLAGSPKEETMKRPLEVSPFRFRIRRGIGTYRILICVSRYFRGALGKLCDLCCWRIPSGIVQTAFL